jgi:hypothetical protein
VTIYENSRTITGGGSGEWAVPAAPGSAVWRLSWLPAVDLTAAQARAGVLLAEILAAPENLAEPAGWAALTGHCDQLNITVPHALSILLRRAAMRRSP